MSAQRVMAIDFGTTATCVATCAGPGASPQIVTHQGPKSSRLPSGVMWWEGQLLVGSAAYNRARLDPAAYEETPKRSLSQGDRNLLLADHDVDIVDALAEVFTEAARPALAQLGNEQAPWVLTHPVAWGPPQLELLQAAAARANAPSVTLLSEPVAAAWGVHEGNLPAGAELAVFDWGGGTLDTAVLEWDGSQFTQAGPAAGEDPLGGEDVDYALEQLVLRRLPENLRHQIENPASRVDRRLGRDLREQTRQAKEELSRSSHTELALSVVEEPIRITRDEFNVIARPIIERCAEVLRRCLTLGGVRPKDLSAIYLVGDSSRIPLVYDVLKDQHPGVLIVPAELGKEAVARGATLAATNALTAQPPAMTPQKASAAGVTATQLIAQPGEVAGAAVHGGATHATTIRGEGLMLREVHGRLALGVRATATALVHLLPGSKRDRREAPPDSLFLCQYETFLSLEDSRRLIQLRQTQPDRTVFEAASAQSDPQGYFTRSFSHLANVAVQETTFLAQPGYIVTGSTKETPSVRSVNAVAAHHHLTLNGCDDDIVSTMLRAMATVKPGPVSDVKYKAECPLLAPAMLGAASEGIRLVVSKASMSTVCELMMNAGPDLDRMTDSEIARNGWSDGKATPVNLFGSRGVSVSGTGNDRETGRRNHVLAAGVHVNGRGYQVLIAVNADLRPPRAFAGTAERCLAFLPYIRLEQ
jgi:actin-like ATPase involved in cell morphogenesis